jgi:hypothetical protein
VETQLAIHQPQSCADEAQNMILKHMAEAILKQNWSVVLIEVLVVVVGIFLGLQVDDWNQDRKDRGDERQYLQRLHADLLIAEKLSDRVHELLDGIIGASHASGSE